MDCFECKAPIPDLNSMWKHFKQVHGLNRNSGFKCTFNGTCDRKYVRYDGFWRHVKKEHFDNVMHNGNANTVDNREEFVASVCASPSNLPVPSSSLSAELSSMPSMNLRHTWWNQFSHISWD